MMSQVQGASEPWVCGWGGKRPKEIITCCRAETLRREGAGGCGWSRGRQAGCQRGADVGRSCVAACHLGQGRGKLLQAVTGQLGEESALCLGIILIFYLVVSEGSFCMVSLALLPAQLPGIAGEFG